MNEDDQKVDEDVFGELLPLCSKTVDDEFLAGETVLAWSNRRHSAALMNHYKAEVEQADAVLAPLLYRMKRRLSRLGRGGRWHAWLKQNRIERSCADRLVLSYAESLGRRYELPSRYIPAPLEGDVCLAAGRACKRVEKKLTTPRSKMVFLSVLANLLDMSVDWDQEGLRMKPQPPPDLNDPEISKVPNVMEVLDDGTIRPVSYELQEDETTDFFPLL